MIDDELYRLIQSLTAKAGHSTESTSFKINSKPSFPTQSYSSWLWDASFSAECGSPIMCSFTDLAQMTADVTRRHNNRIF